MDKRLLTLALGMFALGTDTFVMAGVLPKISQAFAVDIGLAGQLTTVYAISYALLSPTIAAIAASVPRKRLMLSGLGVFIIANLATAAARNFAFALVTRGFAGLGAAMYAPTATGTGALLVAPEHRGKALATIVAGLTVATALGSPIGTVIGGLGDWRWTMLFVSGIGLVAAAGIARQLKHVALPPKISLRDRLAPLSDARVGLTLATTLLGLAGNFLVYTYFAAAFDRILTNAVLFGALLVLWGSGGTATNVILSKVLDKTGPRPVLLVLCSVLIVDMALLSVASANLWSTVLAVGVWGLAGWGIIGPQQYRLVGIGPTIVPILMGLNTAATYLGATIAGILGAAGIHLLGAHNLGFMAAGIFVLTIVFSELASRQIARHTRSKAAPQLKPHKA